MTRKISSQDAFLVQKRHLVPADYCELRTLLGPEFFVPLVQHSNQALIASLVGIVRKFIGYFLAFTLLSLLLINYWRQFQNIAYADSVLYGSNVLFLPFVVLAPFATTVWTGYPDTTAGVLFFDCAMFITGLTLYANWSYVKRRPYLLRKVLPHGRVGSSRIETQACPSRRHWQ